MEGMIAANEFPPPCSAWCFEEESSAPCPECPVFEIESTLPSVFRMGGIGSRPWVRLHASCFKKVGLRFIFFSSIYLFKKLLLILLCPLLFWFCRAPETRRERAARPDSRARAYGVLQ